MGSYREAAREVSPLVPMLVTGTAGAVVGLVLRGWQPLHVPGLTRERLLASIAMVVAAAGAFSGGMVGFVTWGFDGFLRFALGGAIVGLVFTPSCLVVFEAARRSGRGRHGSLVAATDARTVLSTVLGGVAFAAATQVPAILTAQTSASIAPLLQVMLSLASCLAATGAIVVLQRRDRAARTALDAFVADAAWLDAVHAPEEGEPLPPAAVDLGMGAAHWSRSSDSNYRNSGRAEILVKGSIEEAAAAFDECAKRRHRSLLVAASGLTAVVVAIAIRISVYL